MKILPARCNRLQMVPSVGWGPRLNKKEKGNRAVASVSLCFLPTDAVRASKCLLLPCLVPQTVSQKKPCLPYTASVGWLVIESRKVMDARRKETRKRWGGEPTPPSQTLPSGLTMKSFPLLSQRTLWRRFTELGNCVRSSQHTLSVKSKVYVVQTLQLEWWCFSLWPQTYCECIRPWAPYDICGDGALQEVIKGTWDWHGVAVSHWVEGFAIAESWLPRFCLGGYGDKAAVYEPGNEPQPGNGWAWTLTLHFPSFRSMGINAWCWRHPVCGLVSPLYSAGSSQWI